MSVVSDILHVSRTIDSPRNLHSVMSHLAGEVLELDDELYKDVPGEDGILGESVDVILCAVDMIYIKHPEITEEQIGEVVKRKLAKWQRLYGK